jgi:hypothetical protein
MKTLRIILPVVAFLFAIVGAVAMEQKNALLETGYFQGTSITDCTSAGSVDCVTVSNNNICTVSTVRVFKLDTAPTPDECDIPLYVKP